MSLPAQKLTYPHITSDPNISQGAPIIEGTRITVRTIAGYYQMGMDVDEMLTTLSHLTAAQIHSALAYYFDHQAEIEDEWDLGVETISAPELKPFENPGGDFGDGDSP